MRGKSGVCSVCHHPEKTRIEMLVLTGATRISVARKYEMSHDSVSRHMMNHLSHERRATLLMGPVQRQMLAAQVAEESSSVLDHHKATRAGLYRLYDAAITAGDAHSGAMLAARLTSVNNAISRLTGELASSPLIEIHNNNNAVVFASDPGFARFQSDLIRVLSRFPEARAAVIREFERLEAAASPLPALESHGEETQIPERPQPAALEPAAS